MSFVKHINVNDGSDRKFNDVTVSALPMDAAPELNSFNPVTSDGVARAIAGASGEVPVVTENDNGKVLKAVYDEGGPGVEWGDAGSAVTVDQTYDPTSENAQSGNAVSEAISGVNAPPVPEVSDEGKVLSVVVHGDTPSMEWTEPQGSLPDTTGVPENSVLAVGGQGPEWHQGGVPTYLKVSTGTVTIDRDNTVVESSADITGITIGANVRHFIVQWKVSSVTALPTLSGAVAAPATGNPAALTAGKGYQLEFTNGCYKITEFADPYNPLELPAGTIRCKFTSGYTPAMGDTQTLVDADENIWDIYKSSDDWESLFSGRTELLEVLGANSTGVTNMSFMFFNCASITTVPLFDTSSATQVYSMFNSCTSLTTVPLFNTSNVTNIARMFYNCTSLTTVPLFDTSSATDMDAMFYNCTSLTTVPLFDTSSATSMDAMFYNCTSLTSVPLFDTGSVTNMNSMFARCESLATVPLFDTGNVTNMLRMFEDCSSLTTVPLFDTSSVTNMESMFAGCSSLTTVPLFDTSSVTNMVAMFAGCHNVESGALALYQQASSQTNPPSSHGACFYQCGSDSTSGAAELAQIPESWGGTMVA